MYRLCQLPSSLPVFMLHCNPVAWCCNWPQKPHAVEAAAVGRCTLAEQKPLRACFDQEYLQAISQSGCSTGTPARCAACTCIRHSQQLMSLRLQDWTPPLNRHHQASVSQAATEIQNMSDCTVPVIHRHSMLIRDSCSSRSPGG